MTLLLTAAFQVPDLVKVLNLAAPETAPPPVVYQPATAIAAGGTPAAALRVAPDPATGRSPAASEAAQAVQESERASAAAGGPGPSSKRAVTADVPPPPFEGADSSFLLRRGPLLLQVCSELFGRYTGLSERKPRRLVRASLWS